MLVGVIPLLKLPKGNKMNSLMVTNVNGRKFDARVVDTNDNYGLNDGLVNEDDPMVEFYDMGSDNFPNGQFVSRYYVSTITEDDGSYGLNLDGGVPEWSIDGQAMVKVVKFLNLI